MMVVVNTDTLTSMSTGIGGGFFGGLLIGYALKKVIKMIAIVVGLFLATLAYLQYHQIATIHWHRLEGAITKLAATAAATTTGTINDNNNSIAVLAAMMSNFGIPLTSSMSVGFTIGFMKG
jgi:uncharacterized membrane protein (Fun14 family)